MFYDIIDITYITDTPQNSVIHQRLKRVSQVEELAFTGSRTLNIPKQ